MNKPITYKGYTAKIEYSEEDKCLIGRVSEIRHIITFKGDSVKEIEKAFEEAVDVYLNSCAEKKEEPGEAFATFAQLYASVQRFIA